MQTKIVKYVAAPVLGFALLLGLFLLPKANGQPGGGNFSEDWELKAQNDGISAYMRWVEAEPGRKARERKVAAIMDAPISAVVSLIQGEVAPQLWFDRAVAGYCFRGNPSKNAWYTYTEIQMPWPVKNQDMVLANTLSWSNNHQNAVITFFNKPDEIPVKNDVNRLGHLEGSWYLRALENGKTRVEYRVFSNTKPFLPQWVTGGLVRQSLMKTLANLRQIAEEGGAITDDK